MALANRGSNSPTRRRARPALALTAWAVACAAPAETRESPGPADTTDPAPPAPVPSTPTDPSETLPPHDTAPAPCLAPVGVETGLDTDGVALGATLSLGAYGATATLPEVTAATTPLGGTLVFSDSPESVPAVGTLYEDLLPAGTHRIYLYHVNASAAGLRFTAVLAGAGAAATATVLAEARSGPSVDWVYVGKKGAERYVDARVTPPAPRVVAVPADGAVLLDPALDALTADPGELLHAVYDLSLDAPAQVRLLALAPGQDATAPPPPPLARDTHDRGTFADADRLRAVPCYDTAGGTVRLRLASGTADDPWVTGVDALTGAAEDLVGNYGVWYTVQIPLASTDGRQVAALLAPRGGPAAGAVWTAAGLQPEGRVTWPSDADAVAPDGSAALLGRWDPAATPVLTLRFSPAGSTFLPLDLVLIPE